MINKIILAKYPKHFFIETKNSKKKKNEKK